MGKALDNVRAIYLEGIANGDARRAVTAYTGHRYTQHSTGVPDGVDGFLQFFEPFLDRNPEREIRIVRDFQDGEWVFCSAYQSLNAGSARWVTMDLFHTDDDGLILEHWDTIAAYEENTASGHDMVAGSSSPDRNVDTEASKKLVLEFTKQVLQEGKRDRLAEFVAEDLTEHALHIENGRVGYANWLDSDLFGAYEFLFKLVGDGDLVVTYGKRHARGKDIAVFDLYRVQDGKIAEHWMNEEEISSRENWGNSGKF